MTRRRLRPDRTCQLMLQINRGVALMQAGKTDKTIALLTKVLEQSPQGYLGVKYRAAAS